MVCLSLLGSLSKKNSITYSLMMFFPYEQITYGQLTSLIQQVALKICRQAKILREIAKDRAQTRCDLGSFCEQFGLPPCRKKYLWESTPRKEEYASKKFIKAKKPSPRIQQSTKRTTSPPPNNGNCYRCNKPGHIAKYCKLSKKVKNLNLDESALNQIQNLLPEDRENSDYALNLDESLTKSKTTYWKIGKTPIMQKMNLKVVSTKLKMTTWIPLCLNTTILEKLR